MGFLLGGGAKTKQIPAITGLQIQTAVNALPIPLCYGSPRIPMNIIYVNGFHAFANKASGGKGLLSGGKGSSGGTGFHYVAYFIGALGEGKFLANDPANVAVFDNQAVYAGNNPPPGKTMVFFAGDDVQPPWSTITSLWPDDAFSYKDTAYVGFPNYALDSSATIPQLNFMLQTLLAASSPLNLFTAPNGASLFMDADPALCILDFLTHPKHGVGFPNSFIDQTTLTTTADGFNSIIGDAALSTYCQAVGLAWSVCLNNAEPAASILERWCRNLVVAPVWTGAVLKFIPYWDSFNNANPGWDSVVGIGLKYYKPNIPILFDLSDDNFIQSSSGEDPVVVTRIDVADVKNSVRLDYRDRNNQWNSNVIEVRDDNAVELAGLRIDKMGTADEFTFGAYAHVAANMQLSRNLAIRNTYSFRLPWQWCVLDPMDIVTITDTVLALDKFPVRIRSIEEDEKGILTIVAEEFPLGAASPTINAHSENLPPPPPLTNVAAAAVNPPVIFEPTYQMMAAQGMGSGLLMLLGACAGPAGAFDSNWGGCNVLVSNDNITYTQVGVLTQPSRMGPTTATLAAFSGSNPDSTNTLSVNLTESDATLDTVTAVQAASGLTLSVVVDASGDFELLSYTTATLTSTSHYDLTGLYRGLYGTVPCAHPSGSKFLRVDTQVFEGALPTAFVGVPLFIKLQSFNIFNQGLQDVSTCAVYNYTPSGAGTNLAANPIWAALLAGTGVDLEGATGSLDLNLGGSGPCAPILSSVDLEVV